MKARMALRQAITNASEAYEVRQVKIRAGDTRIEDMPGNYGVASHRL